MGTSRSSQSADVGMDELISSAQKRDRSNRSGTRKTRPKKSVFRTIVQVFGELLITVGVVLMLFVGWELWWTNIQADQTQQAAVQEFAKGFQGPVTPQDPGKTDYGEPVVAQAPSTAGETLGLVYIPRFGADYKPRPVVQGTALRELNTLGLGHYTSTAMPGAVGNFAVAGHRQTNGATLDAIHTLVPGDRIYVQTADGYYTYVYRNNEIVLPNQTNVLAAVPTQAGAPPNGRYMTLTSCNPRFGSAERFIAYAVMESWQPISAGPPQEIAQQVQATVGKG
ncbi:MAG: class E sortase [Renibacterium salmoninarum]|nr:class E sortase [Renibacterium salmoninarum]